MLAELDAAQAPEGVDVAVYAQLKDALRAALIARGVDKLPCTPPTGAANMVLDLYFSDTGGGTADLTWHYINIGDYNQDGTVGIADITPLAMHFGQTWVAGEENTLPCVVDGSGDGTVNIADVTPIAMNFGVEAASYIIESSDAELGTYSFVQAVAVSSGLDKDTMRMHYAVNLSPAPSFWYRVVPADGSSNPGIPSISRQYVAPGTPVASIVPDVTSGDAPLNVSFDASASYDPDGTIVKYEWDWEGDGVYDMDSGATPNASNMYNTPGIYDATVRVTDNDAKTATASTAISVGGPQPPVAFIVASVNHGTAPLSVTLDASGSTDADGTIVKYEWDMEGDGVFEIDTGTDPTVDYTYTADGFYHPAVRVTDNEGLTGTMNTDVTVSFPAWVHTWGMSGSDSVEGAYEGLSGHIYLGGNTASLKGGFYYSTLISKYLPTGDPLWVKSWETAVDRDDATRDIALDPADNIYCAGVLWDVISSDAFIVKFDGNGVLQYQFSLGGAVDDYASAVAVDSLGQAYIAGYTNSINTPGDILVIKVNSMGTPMWQKDWSFFNYEAANDVIVDSLGNVFVVGAANGFGAGDTDIVLLKFDTDGNIQWQKRWAGTGQDFGLGLTSDAGGNIYVVGQTDSFGMGNFDGILLKYSPSGTLIWQQTWGTVGYDRANDVAIDKSTGDIYVAGDTDGLGTGVIIPFLLRYNSSGVLVNQMAWDANGEYAGESGLLFSSQHAVYVVGYANNANGAWVNISGSPGISLGTPTDETGIIADLGWGAVLLTGTVTDQTGVIDTGGGNADQLIIKENPLFW